MLRTWLRGAAKAKPMVTIYPGEFGLSSQVFSKLNQHCRGQFEIETKSGMLCPNDFKFLIDCVEMHPDNKTIIHKLFGKRQFDELSDGDFSRMIPRLPLVIDYNNKLVATDCGLIDRILAQYNGCGMQHFRVDHNLVHPNCAEFADLF